MPRPHRIGSQKLKSRKKKIITEKTRNLAATMSLRGDESASSDEDSSGDTSTDSNKSDDTKLAKKETAAVLRLRFLLILALIGAAAAVSIVIYYITRSSQKEEFEIQYEDAAETTIQSFEDIIVAMAAISGLGVAASADSVDYNTQWPFVTLSNFQQRAGNVRALAGVLDVSINPLVTDEQLPAWEEYVLGKESRWM
jgi:hypothetical protein